MVMQSRVAVVKVNPKADEAELRAALEQAVHLLGGIEPILPSNAPVLVKPNHGSGTLTNDVNVRVTAGVLGLLAQHDYPVQIGEDPACSSSQQYEKWQRRVFDHMGLKGACERWGAAWVDFRHGPHRTVHVPDPLFFDDLVVSEFAYQAAAIVSLARLKVVNICSVSLSMKNLKGVMPAFMKRRFHCEGLNQGIVDLCKVIKPRLAIIDGTFAVDQVDRKVKPVGLLLVSTDCVAADAVGARLLGFDPARIEYIALAEQSGLGAAREQNIEVVGEALTDWIGKIPFSSPANPFELAQASQGGIEIIQGQPCSSCLNELGSELMAFKGDLHRFHNLKILVGPTAQAPAGDHTIIYYGNCLKKHRGEANFIPGCPPGMAFLGVGSVEKILREQLRE
jgi:uncharacterized protein (DUF362 family)